RSTGTGRDSGRRMTVSSPVISTTVPSTTWKPPLTPWHGGSHDALARPVVGGSRVRRQSVVRRPARTEGQGGPGMARDHLAQLVRSVERTCPDHAVWDALCDPRCPRAP